MRIVMADDHAMVREGLAALLCAQATWEVVGQAADGEAALTLGRELTPDVMITDIAMPKLSGVEVIRRLAATRPQVRIVALSMHGEPGLVKEALRAGCHAYVLKSCLFEEIRTAVETVLRGERYLSPRIADVMGDAECRAGMGLLTGRERQIVQLLAEGYSVKEAARHLSLSPKTVDATRRKAMHKLDIESVAQLTKFAIREGLTSIEF